MYFNYGKSEQTYPGGRETEKLVQFMFNPLEGTVYNLKTKLSFAHFKISE